MTQDQINALARELAERLYNDDKSYRAILWWCDNPKEEKARELEYALRFLLENYCIVEKSELVAEKERCEKLINNAMTDPERHFSTIARMGGKLAFIETLFPEIFKDKEE